jgi:hypothetical protein
MLVKTRVATVIYRDANTLSPVGVRVYTLQPAGVHVSRRNYAWFTLQFVTCLDLDLTTVFTDHCYVFLFHNKQSSLDFLVLIIKHISIIHF